MKNSLKVLWAVLMTTLMDAYNLFSDDQAITATANSTNVVDQGDGLYDGSARTIQVAITESFNTLTSLTFSLYSDTVEGMGTQVLVFETNAIPLATLVAGHVIEIPIPVQAKQFMRLTYTVIGTNPTAGKVHAGINLGVQSAFRDDNL